MRAAYELWKSDYQTFRAVAESNAQYYLSFNDKEQIIKKFLNILEDTP
jgi:hypothetical protein